MRRHWFGGVVLIVVGCVLLLDRMSLIETSLVWHFWPALVALFGLGHMVGARHPSEAIRGLLLVGLAFWLYASIEHLWGWSFRTTWPFILIGFGLARILDSAFWLSDRQASNDNERLLP
jgi:hypothetical protein